MILKVDPDICSRYSMIRSCLWNGEGFTSWCRDQFESFTDDIVGKVVVVVEPGHTVSS